MEYFSYHPSLWHIPVVRHVPAVLPDLHWRLAVSQKPDSGASRNASSIYCDNRSLCSHFPPLLLYVTYVPMILSILFPGMYLLFIQAFPKNANVCSLSEILCRRCCGIQFPDRFCSHVVHPLYWIRHNTCLTFATVYLRHWKYIGVTSRVGMCVYCSGMAHTPREKLNNIIKFFCELNRFLPQLMALSLPPTDK